MRQSVNCVSDTLTMVRQLVNYCVSDASTVVRPLFGCKLSIMVLLFVMVLLFIMVLLFVIAWEVNGNWLYLILCTYKWYVCY